MKTNWPVKKLGEVTDVLSGVWGPQDNAGTAVLRSTNFNNDGTIAWNEVAYRSIPENKVNQLALNQGDILVEKSGGSPAQPVGRVVYFDAEQQGKVVFGNFISKLQVNDKEIEPKFLFYYLLYFYKTGGINRYQSQTTGIRNLQLKDYLGIEIPKFRTEVQKKIVERLDAIRKAQELCDQQISKTEELFESLLNNVFNQQNRWEVKKLEEVTDVTSSKRVFQKDYVQAGVPFYRTKEIVELGQNKPITLELFISEEQFIDIASKFSTPKQGDILISAVGTIGISWIVPDDRKFYFKDGNLLWIKNFKEINSRYLKLFFDYSFSSVSKLAAGGAYKALTIINLKKFKIPIPSISEQQKIVEKLEAVQNYKKILLKQKTFLKELFGSVLDKSMNGEIDINVQ